MNYLSRASISINLYGDNFNPSEFTKLINIQPTNIGIKGKKGNYTSTLKKSFWEYRTKKSNALEELDESIRSLVFLFEEKIDLIKRFILEKSLNIKCYIIIESINNENNGVLLDQIFISFINDLGAEIEVDVYNE